MSMSSVLMSSSQSGHVWVTGLLEKARRGEREPLGQLLQLYRNYLTILATTQLDRRLRRRMSPSDLVQETMLAAHGDFAKFRGSSERELLAWMDANEYESVSELRGSVSYSASDDPAAFERANYLRTLHSWTTPYAMTPGVPSAG